MVNVRVLVACLSIQLICRFNKTQFCPFKRFLCDALNFVINDSHIISTLNCLRYQRVLQCVHVLRLLKPINEKAHLACTAIILFNILNGQAWLNPLDLFQFRPHGRSMRVHSLTVVKPTVTKAARAGFFSVVSPWNKLQPEVLMAQILESFKVPLNVYGVPFFMNLPWLILVVCWCWRGLTGGWRLSG